MKGLDAVSARPVVPTESGSAVRDRPVDRPATSSRGEPDLGKAREWGPGAEMRKQARVEADEAQRALGKVSEALVEALRLRAGAVVLREHDVPGSGADRSFFDDATWIVARELHAHGWAPHAPETIRAAAEREAHGLAVRKAHEFGTRRTHIPAHGFGSAPGDAAPRGSRAGRGAGPSRRRRAEGDATGDRYAPTIGLSFTRSASPALRPESAEQLREQVGAYVGQVRRSPMGAAPLPLKVTVATAHKSPETVAARRKYLLGVLGAAVEEHGGSTSAMVPEDTGSEITVIDSSGSRGTIALSTATAAGPGVGSSAAGVRVPVDPTAPEQPARELGFMYDTDVFGKRTGVTLLDDDAARFRQRGAEFLEQLARRGPDAPPLTLDISLTNHLKGLVDERSAELEQLVTELIAESGWSGMASKDTSIELVSAGGAQGRVVLSLVDKPRIETRKFDVRVRIVESQRPYQYAPAVGLSFAGAAVPALRPESAERFREQVVVYVGQVRRAEGAPPMEIAIAVQQQDSERIAVRREHLQGVVGAVVKALGGSTSVVIPDGGDPNAVRIKVSTPSGASGVVSFSTVRSVAFGDSRSAAAVRVPADPSTDPDRTIRELGLVFGSDVYGKQHTRFSEDDAVRFRGRGEVFLEQIVERGPGAAPLVLDIGLTTQAEDAVAERRAGLERLLEDLVAGPRGADWSVEKPNSTPNHVLLQLVSPDGAKGRVELHERYRPTVDDDIVDVHMLVRVAEPDGSAEAATVPKPGRSAAATTGPPRYAPPVGLSFTSAGVPALRPESAERLREQVGAYVGQVRRAEGAPPPMEIAMVTDKKTAATVAARRAYLQDLFDSAVREHGGSTSVVVSDEGAPEAVRITVSTASGTSGVISFSLVKSMRIGDAKPAVVLRVPVDPHERDRPSAEGRSGGTPMGISKPDRPASSPWGPQHYAPATGLSFTGAAVPALRAESEERLREQLGAYLRQVHLGQVVPELPMTITLATVKKTPEAVVARYEALQRVLVAEAAELGGATFVSAPDDAAPEAQKVTVTTGSGASGTIAFSTERQVLDNAYAVRVRVPDPVDPAGDPDSFSRVAGFSFGRDSTGKRIDVLSDADAVRFRARGEVFLERLAEHEAGSAPLVLDIALDNRVPGVVQERRAGLERLVEELVAGPRGAGWEVETTNPDAKHTLVELASPNDAAGRITLSEVVQPRIGAARVDVRVRFTVPEAESGADVQRGGQRRPARPRPVRMRRAMIRADRQAPNLVGPTVGAPETGSGSNRTIAPPDAGGGSAGAAMDMGVADEPGLAMGFPSGAVTFESDRSGADVMELDEPDIGQLVPWDQAWGLEHDPDQFRLDQEAMTLFTGWDDVDQAVWSGTSAALGSSDDQGAPAAMPWQPSADHTAVERIPGEAAQLSDPASGAMPLDWSVMDLDIAHVGADAGFGQGELPDWSAGFANDVHADLGDHAAHSSVTSGSADGAPPVGTGAVVRALQPDAQHDALPAEFGSGLGDAEAFPWPTDDIDWTFNDNTGIPVNADLDPHSAAFPLAAPQFATDRMDDIGNATHPTTAIQPDPTTWRYDSDETGTRSRRADQPDRRA